MLRLKIVPNTFTVLGGTIHIQTSKMVDNWSTLGRRPYEAETYFLFSCGSQPNLFGYYFLGRQELPHFAGPGLSWKPVPGPGGPAIKSVVMKIRPMGYMGTSGASTVGGRLALQKDSKPSQYSENNDLQTKDLQKVK